MWNAVRAIGSLGWACATLLVLSACGGAAENARARATVDPDAPLQASLHAGEVEFRIANSFTARERDLPFTLYLGMSEAAGTRITTNAFVDLRDLQATLPDILSGTLAPACGLELDVGFQNAEADGDLIRARAVVDAHVHRCRNRGTESEERGARLLTQTIDVAGTIGGSLEGRCIALRLVDLDLEPRGFLGALATFLGVTDRARDALLARTRLILSESPICPQLPEPLALLDPRFDSFTLREIDAGGIGVAIPGSIDLSAAALVKLLARVDAQGDAVPPAGTLPREGQLTRRVRDSIEFRGTRIAYGVDLGLSAAGPARIDVEAALDLRDLQDRLPALLAGETLLDTCGGRIELDFLQAEGRERRIALKGRLNVEDFDCVRSGPGTWERGDLVDLEVVEARAELSAKLVEGCVVFELHDLSRDPPGSIGLLETGSGRIEAARALLLEAVGLVLEEKPLCPEVPPGIAILDPQFERIAAVERGQGGVGIDLAGSIDVSPANVIRLLQLLQTRGAVPPPP